MLSYKIPGWFYQNKRNRPELRQLIAAAIGTFAGIGITAYFSISQNLSLMAPSFGASAVLLYAASHVPMAQPKNVLGGHVVSALAGVTVYSVLGFSWWTLALGVTLAIIGMMITDTLHPPGGATAFIAVFTHQNYSFILTPVAVGILILVVIAIAVHRIFNYSAYPAGGKINAKVTTGE